MAIKMDNLATNVKSQANNQLVMQSFNKVTNLLTGSNQMSL